MRSVSVHAHTCTHIHTLHIYIDICILDTYTHLHTQTRDIPLLTWQVTAAAVSPHVSEPVSSNRSWEGGGRGRGMGVLVGGGGRTTEREGGEEGSAQSRNPIAAARRCDAVEVDGAGT